MKILPKKPMDEILVTITNAVADAEKCVNHPEVTVDAPCLCLNRLHDS